MEPARVALFERGVVGRRPGGNGGVALIRRLPDDGVEGDPALDLVLEGEVEEELLDRFAVRHEDVGVDRDLHLDLHGLEELVPVGISEHVACVVRRGIADHREPYQGDRSHKKSIHSNLPSFAAKRPHKNRLSL